LHAANKKDTEMGLRRKLLFWGRVVRFNLASMVPRVVGDYRFAPRILGHLAVVAALVAGGYLFGRSSAPACAPLPDANCIEAQAPTPVAPTVVATAPVAPTPPVSAPAAEPSVSATEETRPNPRSTPTGAARPLSNDEVREMQAWLKAFGFDPGPLDGVPGSRTLAAVKRYQAARQTEETGLLDRSLLRQVRRQAGQS
jgi:hypothetical protein